MIEETIKWLNESKTVADIITGMYSSGIFLVVLSLLKPRIKISDRICFQYDTKLKRHITYFKIVNSSVFFKVYDIQMRAWSTKTTSSSNGDNVEYQQINLNKDYQWILHRMVFLHLWQDFFIGEKRLQKRTDYAAQFSTYDNITQLIKSGNQISIEVIAKHSLTGFTRVRIKTYKHINDLKKGEFLSGNSCKVIK